MCSEKQKEIEQLNDKIKELESNKLCNYKKLSSSIELNQDKIEQKLDAILSVKSDNIDTKIVEDSCKCKEYVIITSLFTLLFIERI